MDLRMFQTGNPEFTVPEGVQTYSVDETHGYRLTTFKNGSQIVHRSRLSDLDAADNFWEPWNDPPPRPGIWEEVSPEDLAEITRAKLQRHGLGQ